MCRTARTPARGAEAQGVHRGQLIQPLSEEGLHRVGAAGTARTARGVSIGTSSPKTPWLSPLCTTTSPKTPWLSFSTRLASRRRLLLVVFIGQPKYCFPRPTSVSLKLNFFQFNNNPRCARGSRRRNSSGGGSRLCARGSTTDCTRGGVFPVRAVAVRFAPMRGVDVELGSRRSG